MPPILSLRSTAWDWFRCWISSGASRLLHEPPDAEPHVRWCGRTAGVTPPPTRFVWAALLLGATGAKAEPAITPVKTMVQDILYRADGTVAHGMLTIRWSAFSTSAGQAVPSGELTATIGADGSISIPLIPDTGSSPS